MSVLPLSRCNLLLHISFISSVQARGKTLLYGTSTWLLIYSPDLEISTWNTLFSCFQSSYQSYHLITWTRKVNWGVWMCCCKPAWSEGALRVTKAWAVSYRTVANSTRMCLLLSRPGSQMRPLRRTCLSLQGLKNRTKRKTTGTQRRTEVRQADPANLPTTCCTVF